MDLWSGRWAIFAFNVVQRNSTQRNMDQEDWRPARPLPQQWCLWTACLPSWVCHFSLLTYVPRSSYSHRGPMHSRGDMDRLGMACPLSGPQVYRLQLGLSWFSWQWQSSLEAWGGDRPKNSLDSPAGGPKPNRHCARATAGCCFLTNYGRAFVESQQDGTLWRATRILLTVLCILITYEL